MLSKNIAWIFSGEMINRLSRLVTAIVLAQCLTQTEYGIAAIALASNEMIRVLTQNGIGLKIVKSSDGELGRVCRKVYRVNWFLCISLVLFQFLVSLAVANQYGDERLVYLIVILSLSYLIYPLAMVQVFLAQRANNLKLIAIISATVISTDNLLTALFAVLDFGVLAVVIPKLIVAPLWVYLFRRNVKWLNTRVATDKPVALFRFSFDVLGFEIMKAMRQHMDLFIVGYFFGLAGAGLYAFAKNVGVGISLALIAAFNSAVFPYLCSQKENFRAFRAAYVKALTIAGVVLAPAFLFQGMLAPFYVPIVFGQQWLEAIPILMVLCFSAIPRCFLELNTQMLRAVDATAKDLKFAVYFTVGFLLVVCVAALYSIQWISYGILGVTVLASLVWCAHNYCCFLRSSVSFEMSYRGKNNAIICK
ncbi:MAG: lipopolysaccharide biosynthesis protein [Gammaproteobacteria bacterium]|nr:MAG: lipopolysaccharide biosynthesis protein [Gammaproteobacteria bacterium]